MFDMVLLFDFKSSDFSVAVFIRLQTLVLIFVV